MGQAENEIDRLKELISRHVDIARIEAYFEHLQSENKSVNLVSRETTPTDLYRLAAESLFPLDFINKGSPRYLDIGSGGGFPAFPLIIAGEGQSAAVLLERTQKKVDALSRIIRRLEIKAEAIQADFPIHSFEQQFDLITLRYVKLTPKLLYSVLDLLSKTGQFVYYGEPEFEVSGYNVSIQVFESIQGRPAKQVTIFQKP